MLVTILVGPSGAGKSTWAKKELDAGKDVRIVSADHFFMDTGEYIFDASKIGAAHGHCLRSFVTSLDVDYKHIVVDNTNCSLVEIAPYMALAHAFGRQVRVLVFGARLMPTALVARGTHGASHASVEAQWLGMMEALDPDVWPAWWPKYECVSDGGVVAMARPAPGTEAT